MQTKSETTESKEQGLIALLLLSFKKALKKLSRSVNGLINRRIEKAGTEHTERRIVASVVSLDSDVKSLL